MPNGRKRAERARKEREALLISNRFNNSSRESLTLDQLRSIHFTHIYIHPAFGNTKFMTVFEVYFAIKYNLMNLYRLTPIRIFEYEGQLWSVDNRRLWVMHQINNWHIEGPYNESQSSTRFQELIKKHRGLKGTSGEEVRFRREAPCECCVDACNNQLLDEHIARIHLNMTLDEIKNLSKCILHYQTHEQCNCIGNDEPNCFTLSAMIYARQQRIIKLQQNNQDIIDDPQIKDDNVGIGNK
ncbi:unnamed protein product [Adineta steineri]|uniref:Uncharacterized protein n=2 Tax=Adineta steineri TaxID=433720 RepID=A0A819HZD6_9BILA|nr:unnamed protein product [Adineta steineri]